LPHKTSNWGQISKNASEKHQLTDGCLMHCITTNFIEVYQCFKGACSLHHPDDDVEAASTSEMSLNFYQTTQCNNPEDSHLHTCCHENLKSPKHQLISSSLSENLHPLSQCIPSIKKLSLK
jgi:hypothetical protein